MSVQARLNDLCGRAGFSIHDMAVWLGVGRSTAFTWARGGRTPLAYRLPRIEERLTLLDRALAEDPRLPVPLSVGQYQRRGYVEGIRDDWLARGLSNSCSAG